MQHGQAIIRTCSWQASAAVCALFARSALQVRGLAPV